MITGSFVQVGSDFFILFSEYFCDKKGVSLIWKELFKNFYSEHIRSKICYSTLMKFPLQVSSSLFLMPDGGKQSEKTVSLRPNNYLWKIDMISPLFLTFKILYQLAWGSSKSCFPLESSKNSQFRSCQHLPSVKRKKFEYQSNTFDYRIS